MNRFPFYDLAAKHLPSGENDIIVDIGSGEGEFADYLNLTEKHKSIFLLDGNNKTVEKLRSRFENAILYKAPDRLPFKDFDVCYVHCSHLIEHLTYQELYTFFKEIDRVLCKGGIFIVSTPILWYNFYGSLSHIRPYNPEVLKHYLCTANKNSTFNNISENYSILELVYRYSEINFDESWGSRFFIIDFIMQSLKVLLSRVGIKRYTRNGYTIVLRKET